MVKMIKWFKKFNIVGQVILVTLLSPVLILASFSLGLFTVCMSLYELSKKKVYTVNFEAICDFCSIRGKTWSGDDPKCAFNVDGSLKEDGNNWKCATLSVLREIAYEFDLVNTYEEESIAVIPNDDGDFIILSWYKSRGRTSYIKILDNSNITKNDLNDLFNVEDEDYTRLTDEKKCEYFIYYYIIKKGFEYKSNLANKEVVLKAINKVKHSSVYGKFGLTTDIKHKPEIKEYIKHDIESFYPTIIKELK